MKALLKTTIKLTISSVVLITVASMNLPSTDAQDENFSNLTLGLSGTPAEAFPILSFFTRNGFEPQIHTFKSSPGKGLFLEAADSGGACLLVHNDARAESICFGRGGVGVGTFDPVEALHVFSDDFSVATNGDLIGFDQARILVENQKSDAEVRTMLEMVNNGGARILFDNTGSGESWALMTNSADNMVFSRGGTGGAELVLRKDGSLSVGPGTETNLYLAPNGNMTIAGNLNQQSDRNMKEGFTAVDADAVLRKIASLEITSWNYKDDDSSVRHIGPMAQDFHAAFKVGLNDKTISPVDTAGVSLAAIQALNKRLEEKEDRISQLEDQVAQLMAMMSKD